MGIDQRNVLITICKINNTFFMQCVLFVLHKFRNPRHEDQGLNLSLKRDSTQTVFFLSKATKKPENAIL